MADDDPVTRTTDLPLEVRRGIGFWRASQTHRVFAVSKSRASRRKDNLVVVVTSRTSAWLACRKYGETIGVREGPEYTGWRSNHTANFWVWWAADRGDLHALAAVVEEPEQPYDVNRKIDELWEEFKPEQNAS